jgi:hypothetical protein
MKFLFVPGRFLVKRDGEEKNVVYKYYTIYRDISGNAYWELSPSPFGESIAKELAKNHKVDWCYLYPIPTASTVHHPQSAYKNRLKTLFKDRF